MVLGTGEFSCCDRLTRASPPGRDLLGAGAMLQLEGDARVGWHGHGGLGVMVLPLHTVTACGCPGVVLGCHQGALQGQLGGDWVVLLAMGDSGPDGAKAWGDMGWMKTPRSHSLPSGVVPESWGLVGGFRGVGTGT